MINLIRKLCINFFSKSFCPVCQVSNAGFNPLPSFYAENAAKYEYKHFGKGEMTVLETYSCKNCGASDRERLYAWWMSTSFSKTRVEKSRKAIHFAPEAELSKHIKRTNLFSDYQTADYMMDGVDHKVDLMDIPFENDSFDFFICSHVLEHVRDDMKAIAELFRITKPGGKGILMVPIATTLPKAIEDPDITDESERWRLFGQNDHVRLYARKEFTERIRAVGFKIDELDISFFGSRVFKMLGLKDSSVLYIVNKP